MLTCAFSSKGQRLNIEFSGYIDGKGEYYDHPGKIGMFYTEDEGILVGVSDNNDRVDWAGMLLTINDTEFTVRTNNGIIKGIYGHGYAIVTFYHFDMEKNTVIIYVPFKDAVSSF